MYHYNFKTCTLEQNLYYDNNLMVEVIIKYPHLCCSKPYNCFNKYYHDNAIGLYNYAKDTLYPNAVEVYKYNKEQGYPFNNYQLYSDYTITYNFNPNVSLYYDIYEYTGGAHGNTIRTGNTWSIDTFSLLPLGSFFENDFDYNKYSIENITIQALEKQSSGEVDYFDDLIKNILKYYDENNYYLAKDGYAIFYPLYTLAPYVFGIDTFEIEFP